MNKKKIISIGIMLMILFSFINLPNSFGIFTTTFPNTTDNLYEGHEYEFSTTYYNESDYSQQYSSAILETQFEDFGIANNYTVADTTTMYNYYPSNLTAQTGIYNTEGTANSLDDDYYNITSTFTNPTTPEQSQFAFTNGSINTFGELETIDSNYTIIDPSFQTQKSTSSWNLTEATQEESGDLESIDGSYYKFNSSDYGEAGLFPGTYSFTDDTVGSEPVGWSIDDYYGQCPVQVIASLGDHNKVMEIYDGGTNNGEATQTFTAGAQVNGTIEFWHRTSDRYKESFIYLGAIAVFRIYGADGTYRANNGGSWTSLTSCPNNAWHHIRIDFECDTWGYMGLSADTFYVYINDVQYGAYSFASPRTNIPSIKFATDNADTTYYNYIDAVGYSWDSGYDIGDNKVDGYSILDISNDFGNSFEPVTLIYSFNTSISSTVDVSFYNFDTSNWDLYESTIYTSFSEISFNNFNSSYYNASNYVSIRLEASESLSLYMEVLRLESCKDLNFTSSISLSSFTNIDNLNLYYSFNTSISALINMSIYNFTSLSYYQIQSSVNTSFVDTQFNLQSDFLNNSHNVLIKFEITNSSSYIFYLDKLVILEKSCLNVTSIIDIGSITGLLEFQISSYYNSSSLYQTINFSIYCYFNSSWVLINSSLTGDAFYESLFILNNSNTSKFFSGTELMLVWYAENNSVPFDLYVDFCQCKTYCPLTLTYDISFNLLGTWRYRWIIDSGTYISDWIYFDVIPAEPNIKLISESDKLTEWEFLSTDYTEIELYNVEDFTDWCLEVSDNDYEIINQEIVKQDARTDELNPDINYGTITTFYCGIVNYERNFAFFENNIKYLTSNMTRTNSLSFYVTVKSNSPYFKVHLTDSFDENTITWNNQPSNGSVVSSAFIPNYGWETIDLSTDIDDFYMIMNTTDSSNQYAYFAARQKEFGSEKPYFTNYYSKIFSSLDYTYVQTDETETLKLKSDNNLNLNLHEGDKIEITFNTTSENRIDLNLLYNSSEIGSYIVSQQDNANFNDRTTTLTLQNNITIDQIEFEGLFEDTKNLQISDLKIYRLNATGISESYYVNPQGFQEIFIDFPEDLLIYVYEDYIQVESFNLTTSQTIQFLVYEKINTQTSYIFLYDSNSEYLDYNNFIVYINYTFQEVKVLNKRLSGNQFIADIETTFDYKIYDSFNSLISSKSDQNLEIFIDITLNIYELKLKNEAELFINYSLINNNTLSEKQGLLLPNEIKYYYIASNNYSLSYTNNEDNSNHVYNFEMTNNLIITINSTYFDIYFSLFNYDGLGLNNDLFRFYINNQRKDFGFNTLTQNTNNLKVLDYFNATLRDININLRPYSEYNIAIEVYNLILNNKYNRTVKFEISRTGSDIIFKQTINAISSLSYRFLTNIEYIITIYETDNTYIEQQIINLSTNNQIVDFGFYSTELPVIPKPIASTYLTLFFALIFFVILGMIGIILYYKSKERKIIPPDIKSLYFNKRKPKKENGVIDNRFR